jgi:hypothetical protein
VLAAEYFCEVRLRQTYGGVVAKHQHRVQLALYGQLMAAFEYMLKDFIATVIDATDLWDRQVRKQDWIQVDTDRLLAHRQAQATVGAMLLHPTQGWHDPREVNRRYQALFEREPIESDEVSTLERLWLLRHSVAHNAGFVTSYDAARMGATDLAGKVVHIDAQYIKQSFTFLSRIADRLAKTVATEILRRWLVSVRDLGEDYARDQDTYRRLKLLATFLKSRPSPLPDPGATDYSNDFSGAS